MNTKWSVAKVCDAVWIRPKLPRKLELGIVKDCRGTRDGTAIRSFDDAENDHSALWFDRARASSDQKKPAGQEEQPYVETHPSLRWSARTQVRQQLALGQANYERLSALRPHSSLDRREREVGAAHEHAVRPH